jgi:hypothetical protein
VRQQEAEHHAGGPSAHDAATSLQSARHRFSDLPLIFAQATCSPPS